MELVEIRWDRVGAGSEASWKAPDPLMDHQVVGSDHQVSRAGNELAVAKVEAEWVVVPMRGGYQVQN